MKWDDAKREIERDEESTRPFRLWNPGKNGHDGEFTRWRYYSHLTNAHWGALKELRWAEVGTTIEIIDIRSSKQWGSYTRRVNEVRWQEGDNIPAKFA